jgi:predicted GNAT family N-acyltransferase
MPIRETSSSSSEAPRFAYTVEALGSHHKREGFYSGAPELDRYLLKQAGQDARRKAAAPFVLVGREKSVLGYYTLSAYAVRLSELPAGTVKKLPRYPLLPATLLGRLAVSESLRGQGLGRFLLMDALHRSWRNTSEVASVGVVVEALDSNARAFYLRHEFESLQDHPDKLFLAMATIQKAFEEPRSRAVLEALRGTGDVRISGDGVLSLTRGEEDKREQLLSAAGSISKAEAKRLRSVTSKLRKS